MKQSKGKIWFFLILSCVNFTLAAQNNHNLLETLERELGRQELHVKVKHEKIEALKQEVEKSRLRNDVKSEFNYYLDLFQEYKAFKYDSAYYFLDRAKETAELISEPDLLARVKMKEGFVLLSSGLFMEAVDTLNRVPVSSLIKEDLYEYYFTQARLYYDLSDYNNDQRFHTKYIQKGNFFIEKAIEQVDSSSAGFYAAEGLKRMKQQDWLKAETAFYQLINNYELSPEEFAVAASSFSYVLSQLDRPKESLKYLILAAISDIKSATKENVALRNLASKLYDLGEIERANDYVHQALEDATFYNARHRKFEISSILPIIERAQLFRVEQKNASLKKTVILLALLAVAVLIFLFIIYKQLKEKVKARRILSEYNAKLQEMNRHLEEADAIKQDYITYFLRATSQLFSKIEHFQASTVQKIKTKQPEEVLNVVKQYNIQKERNEVFRQFDEVFLKLFPNFIEEFDMLFPKAKQKAIKSNELLSKEHRIFALYRLGVQDSQQVAEFMDLSVSTIYSYKARLKSHAINKEDFESKIMEIRT